MYIVFIFIKFKLNLFLNLQGYNNTYIGKNLIHIFVKQKTKLSVIKLKVRYLSVRSTKNVEQQMYIEYIQNPTYFQID